MCGRFGLHHNPVKIAQRLTTLFDAPAAAFTPHHNLAPTDMAPVIDASRRMTLARWGLVPQWAKPDTFKALLFNARSETMFEKPSFRDAARSARCIVPASGFYEWRDENGVKQPYWIARRDGEPLLFAGLHADRAEPGAYARTFTIVTQTPGALMQQLHDRQPVMLQTGAVDAWLNPDVQDADTLTALMADHGNDGLMAHPVDRAVGRAGTEGAQLTEPTGPALSG